MNYKTQTWAYYTVVAFLINIIFLPTSIYSKTVSVKGYLKKDGTYVQPHFRTSPDNSFYNNWSTKGNLNPYTGMEGYKTVPSNSTSELVESVNQEVPLITNNLDSEQIDSPSNTFENITKSETSQSDFNLPINSHLELEILENLYSGKNKKGSEIKFRVLENVCDKQGKILIAKGTPAFGKILYSRQRSFFSRRGLLKLEINHTRAVDGQKIELVGMKYKFGGGDQTFGTAATIVWFPLALLRGSNAKISKGTIFNAQIPSNYKIKIASDSNKSKKRNVRASKPNSQEKPSAKQVKVLKVPTEEEFEKKKRRYFEQIYTPDDDYFEVLECIDDPEVIALPFNEGKVSKYKWVLNDPRSLFIHNRITTSGPIPEIAPLKEEKEIIDVLEKMAILFYEAAKGKIVKKSNEKIKGKTAILIYSENSNKDLASIDYFFFHREKLFVVGGTFDNSATGLVKVLQNIRAASDLDKFLKLIQLK